MAIKLADTARPNNYVDAEHLGTYPVAYAEDVWFADGTRLSEKTFDGQSIQKEELPLASADELGNIYQYVGETGTYTKGYFYECVQSSGTYNWNQLEVSPNTAVEYVEELPTAGNIKDLIYVIKDEITYVDTTFRIEGTTVNTTKQSVEDFLNAEPSIPHEWLSPAESGYLEYTFVIPTSMLYLYDDNQWKEIKVIAPRADNVGIVYVGGNFSVFNNFEKPCRKGVINQLYYVGNSKTQTLIQLKTGGDSEAIKDVNNFPTSNIENIIYRTQASTFTVIFDQSNSQMILSKKGFTYTEDTVDGVFIREWTTDIETYIEIDSEYKRVNKIIYKFSPELKRYHKIMYNDEVLHEASESSGSKIFTFKTVSAYYAGDNINQKIERLAKYSDTPFTGTQAEWDALTIDEKLTYKQVNITDDESDTNVVVDAVTNGDMHAVTSNAVYDELKKIQSQAYECSGYLINSFEGEIEGYGRATVTLKDGVAEIKFSARIHTNTMTPTFNWGLNRDLLHILLPDLPVITPINTNSNLQFFAANGTALIDLMGYGAMASGENQFWIPARMYQLDGGTGIWSSDRFPVNSYITGTVYGTYTV